MKLLIQFPTRDRPKRFMKYLLRYVDYIEDKDNFHIQVSCDTTDLTVDQIRNFIKRVNNVSLFIGENKNKIQAINSHIPDSGWDVLLLASDDMWPEVRGYDTIIRRYMEEYFPDTDGVLHFNDGIHGNMLNTLAILGKKYYDRFGYIYHPKYKSVYADNEFDLISRRLGKCRYFDQMIISHKRKEIKKDRLHKINHRYVYHDKLKYYEWKENNII
jgi:hypothetical protein